MRLEKIKGYLKLKEKVLYDIQERDKKIDCSFNPNGCNQEKCKCYHRYCDKFKWVTDRAKHYSEKTKLSIEDILNSWMDNCSYWYMNYFQDCNQPLLDNEDVYVFDNLDSFQKSAKKSEYRCPSCKGISTNPYECNSNKIVKDIKDGKKRKCNWKSYGLFQFGLVYIYLIDKCKGNKIFKPIAWEKIK